MISIYERIENLVKDNKNTTFKLIAKQILEDFNNGIFKSQNELAVACYVSMSTITQFSKAAQCEGYKELAIRLKIEYENAMVAAPVKEEINYKELDTKSLEVINDWAMSSADFILELAKQINTKKKIWIAPSFQTSPAARHFENILRNQGIDVHVMDSAINLELVRHVDFKDELILVIMTGRDTITLSRILEYLEKITKNVYVITTNNHTEEIPDVNGWKKILINYALSGDYKYRAQALMTLFLLIAEKIDGTTMSNIRLVG
ncbi:MurR/RpiR family transcriptional regulator [Spiroplasma tabanidicola]|uniref:HTH rpiR-type domain-containing protein n=1 Tax=Spiroplasma tabanidicola TaxID=324079 RepID=A0A6I6C6P1_9MOLU|nr:hypothetical protein [Spiroplasma tabanidicola]QGS51860.1 hypothetical protein STABA_v1c04970 [Spiroplasma tabanidicola]